jgi:hypothetical protein
LRDRRASRAWVLDRQAAKKSALSGSIRSKAQSTVSALVTPGTEQIEDCEVNFACDDDFAVDQTAACWRRRHRIFELAGQQVGDDTHKAGTAFIGLAVGPAKLAVVFEHEVPSRLETRQTQTTLDSRRHWTMA